MKKILQSAKGLIFASAAMLAVAMSASAQNCAEAVDKMCNAFSSVTERVSQCKSITTLDSMGLDVVIDESGIEDLADDCGDYVLTADDKARLNAACDKYIDTMAVKTVELTKGSISKAQAARELDPTRDAWKKAVGKAKTIADFVYELEDV